MVRNYTIFKQFLENKKSDIRIFNISGVNISFLAYFISQIYNEIKPENYIFWFLFPEEENAKEFLKALEFFNEKIKTAFYPSNTLPPFIETYTYDKSNIDKIKILWNLPQIKVLAGEITSFFRKTIPLSTLKKVYIYLLPGEKIIRDEFSKNLIYLGYERVGNVKEKGQFTIKGAVIDIWSPAHEFPIRIDLFGDEILNLKYFSPDTQRSFSPAEELIVLPCREVFFSENIQKIYKKLFDLKNKISESRFIEILNQIENKNILENEDFLVPLFHEKLVFLGEILKDEIKEKEIITFLFNPSALQQKAENFWEKLEYNAYKAKSRGKLIFEENEIYLYPEEFFKFIKNFKKVQIFEIPTISEKPGINFNIKKRFLETPKETNLIERGFYNLSKALSEGERVILAVSHEKNKEIILEGLKLRGVENLENLEIKKGKLKEGFLLPEEYLWVTSEYELFRRIPFKRTDTNKEIKKTKSYFRKFEDLKPGDFVVHKYHGIGKYQGLVSLQINGMHGEFLQIEYEGGDKLYLPVTRLDELYPYIGVSDKEPKLDKLGKKTFLKRKKKVEKAIAEVVQELLTLYAERKALKSYSLSFPALAYEEIASTFPFEETPDQQIAIEEIIKDLCSDKPMERLLVGDVGFGKTEVALRAIFLVAYSGKQVAFLVPTTILAEQHYRTLKQRLEPFNIKVGILSRLRSSSEQKETLKKLAKGEIKVIIGTHRLLSSDVIFKDLGLLVIDEEHKFGVKQKEKLKQLKKDVKVLSLSATPIPRSLQLSLLGIFDLSVIETPPPGRKPIKTILAKFEPEIIKHAIVTELKRGGQVFFVNPRIQGLRSLANYIKKLVPFAKIGIIHGQMPSNIIEENLYKFLDKEINVLVCTPIIGSGIDIPTTNTIIINRADMFGLADIYQLRGRVGRSDQEAYAYLLVPSLKVLSEEAQKRLKALMEFTELGSGFKLALSDLKIRGAGQLLGINQSGHINSVGYELYLELLENTIKAIKGEKIEDWDPQVDIKVPAFIPQKYIPEAEERLSLYRELVLIKTLEELKEFKEFLIDKYGNLPEEVENLIKIYQLKLLMKQINIPLIETRGNNLILLIKDPQILPKFRKVSKSINLKIFQIRKENELTKISFKYTENPLDISLKIIENLLN